MSKRHKVEDFIWDNLKNWIFSWLEVEEVCTDIRLVCKSWSRADPHWDSVTVPQKLVTTHTFKFSHVTKVRVTRLPRSDETLMFLPRIRRLHVDDFVHPHDISHWLKLHLRYVEHLRHTSASDLSRNMTFQNIRSVSRIVLHSSGMYEHFGLTNPLLKLQQANKLESLVIHLETLEHNVGCLFELPSLKRLTFTNSTISEAETQPDPPTLFNFFASHVVVKIEFVKQAGVWSVVRAKMTKMPFATSFYKHTIREFELTPHEVNSSTVTLFDEFACLQKLVLNRPTMTKRSLKALLSRPFEDLEIKCVTILAGAKKRGPKKFEIKCKRVVFTHVEGPNLQMMLDVVFLGKGQLENKDDTYIVSPRKK